MGHTTDFLVSRGSFIEGLGRLLDFSGSMNVYSRSATPEEADSRAMASDFGMVGQDLRNAINEQKEESFAG